jgi:hypothetical protein
VIVQKRPLEPHEQISDLTLLEILERDLFGDIPLTLLANMPMPKSNGLTTVGDALWIAYQRAASVTWTSTMARWYDQDGNVIHEETLPTH